MGTTQVKIDDAEFLGFDGIKSEADKIKLVHQALAEKAEMDILKEAQRRSDAIQSGDMRTLTHDEVAKNMAKLFP